MSAKSLRGEHGREADEGDVRGDEEDGGGEGDGGSGGEMAALCAQQPRDGRAEAKAMAASAAGRRSAAKLGIGEVEEVRHGEGVVADVAMGEEVADVGDEGEVARAPEAVGESVTAMARPRTVKAAWAKVIQRREDLSVGEGVFGAGERGGDEDQEREVGGEGVVLLIGGEGEEDEDERGEEAEQEGGALVKVELRSSGVPAGVELALAKFVDEEDKESDEDGEEVGNVDAVAQEDADGDDGEGLPVGDPVDDRVGLVEAPEAAAASRKRTPQKRLQGKSQTRCRLQKR